MLVLWAVCFALFFGLPFKLVGRDLTIFGFVMLGASILCFCLGAWLRSPVIAQSRPAYHIMPEFKRADVVLIIASIIGMLMLLIEWRSNGGGLAGAWDIRSERTTALMTGAASGSSLWFQIGFLFAPVGYVVIARSALFGGPYWVARLAVFGFGPLVLSSMALGGRAPLLWGFTTFGLSILTRRWVLDPPRSRVKKEADPRAMLVGALGGIAALAALNYFVNVFIIRAESVGGVDVMFDTVAYTWGVTFEGTTADLMKATFGLGNTYLIFAFSWYIVQGIVISNVLFSDYVGSPQFGIYGIELASALARRVDGNYVGMRNLELFDLNVFGFLPSAWGTLYVDYWYFGLLVAALWGYLAALVYSKVRTSVDARWALASPFVMQGILSSFSNTPLGATNGAVTLTWMIVAFVMSKPRWLALPAPDRGNEQQVAA